MAGRPVHSSKLSIVLAAIARGIQQSVPCARVKNERNERNGQQDGSRPEDYVAKCEADCGTRPHPPKLQPWPLQIRSC